jgi:hypothetical protein
MPRHLLVHCSIIPALKFIVVIVIIVVTAIGGQRVVLFLVVFGTHGHGGGLWKWKVEGGDMAGSRKIWREIEKYGGKSY